MRSRALVFSAMARSLVAVPLAHTHGQRAEWLAGSAREETVSGETVQAEREWVRAEIDSRRARLAGTP